MKNSIEKIIRFDRNSLVFCFDGLGRTKNMGLG